MASLSFGFTITSRNISARMRESTQTTFRGCSRAKEQISVTNGRRHHAALRRFGLIGDEDDVESRRSVVKAVDDWLARFAEQAACVVMKSIARQVLGAGLAVDELGVSEGLQLGRFDQQIVPDPARRRALAAVRSRSRHRR